MVGAEIYVVCVEISMACAEITVIAVLKYLWLMLR